MFESKEQRYHRPLHHRVCTLKEWKSLNETSCYWVKELNPKKGKEGAMVKERPKSSRALWNEKIFAHKQFLSLVEDISGLLKYYKCSRGLQELSQNIFNGLGPEKSVMVHFYVEATSTEVCPSSSDVRKGALARKNKIKWNGSNVKDEKEKG